MPAVVERVSRAKVTVNGWISGEIGMGLLVLLGVGQEDTDTDANYLAEKIAGLRIFEDHDGKMNRSVQEVGGVLLQSRSSRCTATCAAASVRRSTPRLRPNTRGGSKSFSLSVFVRRACAAKQAASRK